MRGTKAKALRRLAKHVGAKSMRTLYTLNEQRKQTTIIVHPGCFRGVYQKLKREVKA